MQGRVLLALSRKGHRRLRAALTGFDVTSVSSTRELQDALAAQQFDMVFIGVHFAESNALRIIPEIRRADPRARIACVRAEPFRYVTPSTIRAVRLACEALDIDLFVDLFDYPDDSAGNRAIRELFEKRLSATRA